MKIKVSVRDDLAKLIEQYFKASNENYETLLNDAIVARLQALNAVDLL